MKKLDTRGFTLVEVIAAVAILAVLLILLVPNVGNLLRRNENDSYNNLKQSIIVAVREYINDNRYNITLSDDNNSIFIDGNKLIDNKLYVSVLLDNGYLSSTGSSDSIINPKNKNQELLLEQSYVVITFNGEKNDYDIALEDEFLKWE